MIQVKAFTFNPIQVNCYVISAENNECLIIDPSCYFGSEYKELFQFIKNRSLKPVGMIATHFHFDHVMGAVKVGKEYGIQLAGHEDYKLLFENFDLPTQIQFFDFEMEIPNPPEKLLKDGDIIHIGNEVLKVLHIPGHSPCGIALLCEQQNIVFSGDILFEGSIGRTDLYMGDSALLISGIQKKLLVLNENTVVYSGHGAFTTIGDEKRNNPFLYL